EGRLFTVACNPLFSAEGANVARDSFAAGLSHVLTPSLPACSPRSPGALVHWPLALAGLPTGRYRKWWSPRGETQAQPVGLCGCRSREPREHVAAPTTAVPSTDVRRARREMLRSPR